MKTAPHVLMGTVSRVINEQISVTERVTAKIAVPAKIMQAVIEHLSRPDCALLRNASNGIAGVGFDSVYKDCEKRAYTTLSLPLSALSDFLAAMPSGFDNFRATLRDAAAEWEKLPTPPTHIYLDGA